MEIKVLDFIPSDNPPLTVDGDLSEEEELKAIKESEIEDNL